MKILILHGPNMNLFGLKSSYEGSNLTLDKINRHIRKYIRDKNFEVKIIQTHNESKAVSYIQNNRKKIDGLIITPCAWSSSGYVLDDLLKLIKLQYMVINLDNSDKNILFQNGKIIFNNDILVSFEEALNNFNE
tara:strand:- start:1713 stop:2114 length:402 start_codon:yes stop_codon:yes gene_type:complete